MGKRLTAKQIIETRAMRDVASKEIENLFDTLAKRAALISDEVKEPELMVVALIVAVHEAAGIAFTMSSQLGLDGEGLDTMEKTMHTGIEEAMRMVLEQEKKAKQGQTH